MLGLLKSLPKKGIAYKDKNDKQISPKINCICHNGIVEVFISPSLLLSSDLADYVLACFRPNKKKKKNFELCSSHVSSNGILR